LTALGILGVSKTEINALFLIFQNYSKKKPSPFKPLYLLSTVTRGLILTIFSYRLIKTRIKTYRLFSSETKFQKLKENSFSGKFFEDLVVAELCCNRICTFRATVNQQNLLKRRKKNFFGIEGVEIDKDTKNSCYCSQHYKVLQFFDSNDIDLEIDDQGNVDPDYINENMTSTIKKNFKNYIEVIKELSHVIKSIMIDLFYYPKKKIANFMYYQKMIFGDDRIPPWIISMVKEIEMTQIPFKGKTVGERLNVITPRDETEILKLHLLKVNSVTKFVLLPKKNETNGIMFDSLSKKEKLQALKNNFVENIIPPKFVSCCKKWSKYIYRRWRQKYFLSFNKCKVYSSIGNVFLIRKNDLNGHFFVRACNKCGILKQVTDPLESTCFNCYKEEHRNLNSIQNIKMFKGFFL